MKATELRLNFLGGEPLGARRSSLRGTPLEPYCVCGLLPGILDLRMLIAIAAYLLNLLLYPFFRKFATGTVFLCPLSSFSSLPFVLFAYLVTSL